MILGYKVLKTKMSNKVNNYRSNKSRHFYAYKNNKNH